MKPRSTSTTIQKARNRADRHLWDGSWIRSEIDARAVLDAGCYFDMKAAQRVVNFFHRLLRHAEGEWAGKAFSLLDWQRDELVLPLFGWKRADQTRRHRRGGIWIPKKNGKSTILSGIAGYLHIGDEEPGAEVYSAANDRAQAGIIFKHYRRMVESSPLLLKRIGRDNIIPSTKTIYDTQTGSTFMSLSADAPTKEGLNIHGLIVDEIHAMKSRTLWDTLIYGGAARRQPLVLSISTAGVYDIGTIGWEQYSYAKSVLDGTNDADWSFFALVYEAGRDDDWTSPETWKKANPSYGHTVKIDALTEECREAQSQPRKQNAFRRYRLNQWVQQATRWIPLEQWDANWDALTHEPVTAETMAGKTSDGGLDLGSVSDLSAWLQVFECESDPDAVDVLAQFWIPAAALTNEKNPNRALYQQWVKDGWLKITPGSVTDYDFIQAAIVADAQVFNLRGMSIDRLFQGQQLSIRLAEEGIEVFPLGQGFLGQGPPTKEFERKWTAGKVHHGGNPILRWMADNVEVKADPAGNLKIVKPNHHNDPRKVDGMTALVGAFDRYSRNVGDGRSVWEDPTYEMATVTL